MRAGQRHREAAWWWRVHPPVGARAAKGARDDAAFSTPSTPRCACSPTDGVGLPGAAREREKKARRRKWVLGFDRERSTQGFVQPGITLGRRIRTSGRHRSGREADPSGRERFLGPGPRTQPDAWECCRSRRVVGQFSLWAYFVVWIVKFFLFSI
jgi:hypothetical protein